MKQKWMSIIMVFLVLLLAVPVASANTGCPPPFHPHIAGDMHGNGHKHVGLAMDVVDKNGNGVICVNHVGQDETIHVHIDDFIPQ